MKPVRCIPRPDPNRTERDKVVDLAAWKAEHLAEPDEPETGRMSAPGRCGRREPVRRGRWTVWDWTELAATLAVAVVLVALAVRVLLV